MTKCADCTIAGPCVVQWTGHRPFCGWMKAGGAMRDRVVELSADPPPGFADAPEPARPDVAGSLALLRAMKRCPFRSTGPGCGCGGARCALKGGAIVNHIDCMECVRQYGA